MDLGFGLGSQSGSPKNTGSGELFADAKAVFEAGQATFRGETDKVDKLKIADSAGDLLGAASEYGKLDEKGGLGGYVKKAEDYLHQYGSSSPAAGSATTAAAAPAPGSTESGGSQSGGGVGEYAKMAEGLLKTNSGGGGGGGDAAKSEGGDDGGGYGEVLKMAGGFLGKN